MLTKTFVACVPVRFFFFFFFFSLPLIFTLYPLAFLIFFPLVYHFVLPTKFVSFVFLSLASSSLSLFFSLSSASLSPTFSFSLSFSFFTFQICGLRRHGYRNNFPFRFFLYWLFTWPCDFSPKNLELHLGCHACWLGNMYVTLVSLWCGRTGVRSLDYKSLPKFRGCMDNQIFLLLVLRYKDSRHL